MSAESLRNKTTAGLNEQIETFRHMLEAGTQQPLEKLREWQGTIIGLKLAQQALDHNYQRDNF